MTKQAADLHTASFNQYVAHEVAKVEEWGRRILAGAPGWAGKVEATLTELRGRAGDMDHSLITLFCWLSALIALPTVVYAGQPFYASALFFCAPWARRP